ncbi:hypothetical protein BFW01_g6821 [Lasiodiplodia theobromae]|uniref:BTB domain-containing protein n=1 Tax=Lasiodiplodia theobromae TaxID=45133 RepID=A0A5N5DX15_9PEZI|nr:Btb poz domain containing protein [Lasiodiplodia theobromae]KAB2580704.1 hypothetical protein DBV05_g514 [Lasiodiplodia theobromae]KAF4542465.1 Btb poz domain containing protein [Lasiodiplodia theobromae]KAF9635926.1 hypothetical protein BFW01_g6821 [Lasiodiplodia theobromae]
MMSTNHSLMMPPCLSICPVLAKLNDAVPKCDTWGEILRVIVGQGEQQSHFYVHRGVICAVSPCFDAAFNGYFKEAKDNVIYLDEDDSSVFRDFYKWLYTRCLPDLTDPIRLIKLAIFADARIVDALRIAAIDALVENINQYWRIPVWTIPYVYEHTRPNSGLRKLVVDMVLRTQVSIADAGPGVNVPEFVADYNAALHGFSSGERIVSQAIWRNTNRCKYHEHVHDPIGWAPPTRRVGL